MRRVQKDEDWYLFDPADVMDLTELYGDDFAKRYNFYIKQAEEGKIKRFEKNFGARAISPNFNSTAGNQPSVAYLERHYQCSRVK